MSTTEPTPRESAFEKAEPAAPPAPPNPTAGGSYHRDPKTGELTQVVERPIDPADPADPA